MVEVRRSRKTTAKWNLFFSYFAIVYALVAGIFFVPLYVANIPLELYGAWLASGNLLFWLSTIDMGLGNVIMQRVGVAYGKGDNDDVGGYIVSGMLVAFVVSLLICLIGYLVSGFLPSLVDLPKDTLGSALEHAFLLAVVGTSLSILGQSASSANSGLQGSFSVGVIGTSSLLGSLVVIFIGITSGLGILAIAWGLVVRGVILLLGNIVYLLWRLSVESFALNIGKKYFEDIRSLFGFTSLGTIGVALSERTDAVVLANFLGPELVPILALTKRAPSLVEGVLARPTGAFAPTIAHLIGESEWGKAKAVLARLLRITIWAAGLAAAGSWALNEAFVGLWVGSDFYAGDQVNLVIVFLVLLALPLRSMAVLCSAMGDIKRIAISDFLRGVVTVICTLIGVTYFGLLGVALAPLVGLILVTAIYVPRSFARLLKLGYKDISSLAKEFVVVSFVFVWVGNYLPLPSILSWVDFFVAILVVMLAGISSLLVVSNKFRSETVLAVSVVRLKLRSD